MRSNAVFVSVFVALAICQNVYAQPRKGADDVRKERSAIVPVDSVIKVDSVTYIPAVLQGPVHDMGKDASFPARDEFVDLRREPVPDADNFRLEYPEYARRAGLEGKVIVTALINKLGQVTRVEIERSDNTLFSDAAAKALIRTHFSPAIGSDGKARAVWISRTINFKLRTGE